MRNIGYITTTAPLLLALALLGCSSGTDATDAAAGSSDEGTSDDVDLMVADTELGEVIVDGEGLTAYVFDMDTAGSGESSCTGQCLSDWPPVTTGSGEPQVDGVTGDVDTITAPNGDTQITLEGLPLYLFAGDAEPGDVTGQAVNDVWWVVGPDGSKITNTASSRTGGYSR